MFLSCSKLSLFLCEFFPSKFNSIPPYTRPIWTFPYKDSRLRSDITLIYPIFRYSWDIYIYIDYLLSVLYVFIINPSNKKIRKIVSFSNFEIILSIPWKNIAIAELSLKFLFEISGSLVKQERIKREGDDTSNDIGGTFSQDTMENVQWCLRSSFPYHILGEIENPDFSLGCFSPHDFTLADSSVICRCLKLHRICRKRFRVTLKRTRNMKYVPKWYPDLLACRGHVCLFWRGYHQRKMLFLVVDSFTDLPNKYFLDLLPPRVLFGYLLRCIIL